MLAYWLHFSIVNNLAIIVFTQFFFQNRCFVGRFSFAVLSELLLCSVALMFYN